MTNFGLTRASLSVFARAYRADNSALPPELMRDKIRKFFSAHLVDEASDIVDGEPDGFRQFMLLLKRFEHLRLGRFTQPYEKLIVGVVYQNSIDKLFRDFRDIALMLKDWGTTLDDRQLIAFILRTLPETFLAAKSLIDIKTNCTLEEARSILQSHADRLNAQKWSSNIASLGVCSSVPLRTADVIPSISWQP